MSYRSPALFAQACRDLRNEGRQADPAFLVGGRFDVRAIMQEAVRLARTAFRTVNGGWRRRMSVALKTAWKRAKAAAAAPVLPAPAVALRPLLARAPRPAARAVRAFASGSRISSHGW